MLDGHDIFTFIWCKNIKMCVWKDENKWCRSSRGIFLISFDQIGLLLKGLGNNYFLVKQLNSKFCNFFKVFLKVSLEAKFALTFWPFLTKLGNFVLKYLVTLAAGDCFSMLGVPEMRTSLCDFVLLSYYSLFLVSKT